MEHTNGSLGGNVPLEHLVAHALGEIERLRYSRRSQSRYRAIWRHLITFAHQQGLGDAWSGDLAARFLEAYHVADEEADPPGEGWRRHMAFAVKVLADFARHGRIERTVPAMEQIQLLPTMQHILRDYERYGQDRLQLRSWTLHRRATELTVFMDFLQSRNVQTLDHLQAQDVSDFLVSRDHLHRKTVARIVSDLRSFLRFLLMRGVVHKDFSGDLPTIRVPRDASIPSVWDHALVEQLLATIDRSSAKGKRDYAILLLACRLGLRAGDIRTLKLDDLHWDEAILEITTSKTGTPLRLPLTEEVGEGLITYLKSGRPHTVHREVFLKVTPPFEPFRDQNNLYHIVTYWRRLAGITFRTPHKRGLHSLRHSLATRLLEQGTAVTTIADILGHTTVESTRIYAKATVEALRSVALDPEEGHHVT